jgi:molybdopterin-guanine dinucleotide biosynthesis protein A
MLTIAIQAGGQSTRMGRDKALVKLHGKPLIEHVLEQVHDLGNDLLITTNSPKKLEYLGVRLVHDRIPGAGALYGLETALLAAEGDYALLVACDAPFISRRLLEYLIDLRSLGDVIIPKKGDRYEPLQAVYNRTSCLPAVSQALQSGEKRMISFFPSIQVHTIDGRTIDRLDPAGISFFNINTPADLVEAEEILRRLQNE